MKALNWNHFCTSAATVALLVYAAPAAAFALDQAQPAASAAPAGELEELVVTGSRIRRVETTTADILDAEDEGTPGLVRRYSQQHGLAGLRLFGGRDEAGQMPWLNSPSALKSWAAVDECGIVMDIEVLARGGGGPSVPAIIELARTYSNTRVVLDHLLEPEQNGTDNFGIDERYLPMAEQANIYFKFTSINLDIYREEGVPATDVLRRAVDIFGADHIMWGSDIGTSSGTYKDMVERMLAATAKLTEAEARAVLHDTGKTVF